jgi:multidrug resistance efflux pump
LAANGYRKEDVEQARAMRDAAKAELSAIGQRVRELTIVSPTSGIIEALELQPGDLVAASAPVLSIMDDSRLWVRAYVPESRLDLAVDDPVWVSVDAYPGERFAGRVSFVSRQAEFTPSNIQTPEERSKQVFRIKVTITQGRDRLRAGMAADVWLGTDGLAPRHDSGTASR